MGQVGRNDRCPCGSGSKYKRCCLRREDAVASAAARAEGVWGRMQGWALAQFPDELGDALGEHLRARGVGTPGRPATDDDLSLSLCWLLIDRGLDDGRGTPAQRYADLPGLSGTERDVARCIARSRLGLHRVTDVGPGAWIDLDNVLDGTRTRVTSPNVSQDAVCWDVLLCRVLAGGPTPSLWGGALFYDPSEEDELLAELRRLAGAGEPGTGAGDLGTDAGVLERALQVGSRELLCFVPPSRGAERVPCTLEGDTLSFTEATWTVTDPAVVRAALFHVPELTAGGGTEDGEEGLVFDWITSRRSLIARRGALPPGAILIEGGPMTLCEDGTAELEDVTSFGRFTLRSDHLEFAGLSEQRVDAAVALVAGRLADLVGQPTRRVRSMEELRSAPSPQPPATARAEPATSGPGDGSRPPITEAAVRRAVYRRWLDGPNQRLDGLSPREAAASGAYRDDLERLLRGFEHRSASESPDHRPGPDVAWLRTALHLDGELTTTG